MKQKVSTLVESGLLQRIKLEAVVQQRQINEIVGEALELYLQTHGSAPASASSIAASSWGALRLDPEQIRLVMDEEDGLFDANEHRTMVLELQLRAGAAAEP